MKARIKFRKYGVMRFIGHLDVMRFFQKAMRRANIPIAFTGGYSPHMIMSFAQPLGVGITSDGEYLDIELKEEIGSKEAVRRLNKAMVEGIEVVNFCRIPEDKKSSGMTIVAAASYRALLLESARSADLTKKIPPSWKEKATAFLQQKSIVVLKRTKRSETQTDIKPMIYQMRLEEEGIYMFLAAGSEQNLKPDLVIGAFLKFIGEDSDSVPFHYHRIDIYAKRPDKLRDSQHAAPKQDTAGENDIACFVPLDQYQTGVFEYE